MNEKTAGHLNYLHREAEPTILKRGPAGVDVTRGSLTKAIKAVGKRHMDDAIAEEIRRAATEKRKADVYGSYTLNAQHNDEAIATDLGWDEMVAVVGADNTRRELEYEAYRLACSQGVAVPPPGK